MNSAAPANQKNVGGFVPLTRVKTLVSMTTPKDLHIQNNSILPPFIEFDMSSEGFGCLYIPSLSPQSSNSNSVVGVNSLSTLKSEVHCHWGQSCNEDTLKIFRCDSISRFWDESK